MTWAVITDLDGTLLDHETYSWEGAEPALDLLRQRGIPVVLCTSKTWAETRRLAERMGISGPAIVENGSAVRFGDEQVVLGTPRARVLEAFREMQAVCRQLRGMSDMEVDEVARRTGLPWEAAALAKQREFTEPFVAEGDVVPRQALHVAMGRGLRVSRGGRFFHLHGPCDKGKAVGVAVARLRPRRTIGLGDSEADLPLLEAVTVPVAIPKKDGGVDPSLLARLRGVRVAPEPGPRGWTAAVIEILQRE